jgi:hypothetical protein
MLLKAYSGIELSNYFIILIFLESEDISQVFGLTSYNDSIKDWIMLILHLGPINLLRICHWFIEGLLKKRVKSIIIGILRLSMSKYPSIFPHRHSLALVANSHPPCRIRSALKPRYRMSTYDGGLISLTSNISSSSPSAP